MSYIRVAVLAGTLSVGSGCLVAQNRAQDTTHVQVARASRAAATAGLETLRQLARENFRTVGFASPDEAAAATLGEPLVVFYVRLDSLRAFTAQSDPVRLLSGGDQVIYPVLVGAASKSSIQLARKDGEWKATQFGGARLIATLSAQRTSVSTASQLPESNYFLVRVLALKYDFIAQRSAQGLTLTPVADDPRGRWRAGTAMPAAAVFTQLVTDARAATGLPGE